MLHSTVIQVPKMYDIKKKKKNKVRNLLKVSNKGNRVRSLTSFGVFSVNVNPLALVPGIH